MTTKKSTTKKTGVPPVERPAPDKRATGQTSAENPEEEMSEDTGPADQVPQENNPAEQEITVDNPGNETSQDPAVNSDEAYNHLPIVLVVTKNEQLAELISTCIIKEFDTPVAMIIPDYDPEKNMVEKLTDLISTFENETVILFDSIIPVNKLYMHDIGTIYAERTKEGWNYNTKTPVLLERSKIVELLEEKPDISDADFLNEYFRKFYPGRLPTVVDWRNDTFTLPIVSDNPSFKILWDYVSRKRWFYVSDVSANAVLKFFHEE